MYHKENNLKAPQRSETTRAQGLIPINFRLKFIGHGDAHLFCHENRPRASNPSQTTTARGIIPINFRLKFIGARHAQCFARHFLRPTTRGVKCHNRSQNAPASGADPTQTPHGRGDRGLELRTRGDGTGPYHPLSLPLAPLRPDDCAE